MTFNDTDLYCQILGSIMKDPSVLGSLPMPIAIDDFSTENQIAYRLFIDVMGALGVEGLLSNIHLFNDNCRSAFTVRIL